MLTSEFIVGLWFFPIVMFVCIPLAMLSAWLLYQFLGAIYGKIRLVRKSAGHATKDGYTPLQTNQAGSIV